MIEEIKNESVVILELVYDAEDDFCLVTVLSVDDKKDEEIIYWTEEVIREDLEEKLPRKTGLFRATYYYRDSSYHTDCGMEYDFEANIYDFIEI